MLWAKIKNALLSSSLIVIYDLILIELYIYLSIYIRYSSFIYYNYMMKRCRLIRILFIFIRRKKRYYITKHFSYFNMQLRYEEILVSKIWIYYKTECK